MLAQQGRFSECAVSARLALETIAWADAVSLSGDGEDPLQISTSRAITISKKEHPSIGRLYGVLSKFAHWHADVHLTFLGSDGGFAVMLERTVGHKICGLILILALSDLAIDVFITHMKRYHSAVSTAALSLTKYELPPLAARISSRASGKIRDESLALEIAAAWIPAN